VIPAGTVEETCAQIAECRRVRALARELLEVSADLCDAQLGTAKAAKKDFVETVEPDVRREVAAEAGRLVGSGALDDFQAVEAEARRVALAIMARAVAGQLNADRSDEAGPRLPCPLRLLGALRRASAQDLHHDARPHDAGARLVPLRRVPPRR